MNTLNHYVVFLIEDKRCALYIADVDRIVRAVEVTPLPDCRGVVLGVINVLGKVIPVINMRHGLSLIDREIDIQDRFIIARGKTRNVALAVDEVLGVIEAGAERVALFDEINPGTQYIHGVIKFKDELILIYDLDKFLSYIEDEERLREAKIIEIEGDA